VTATEASAVAEGAMELRTKRLVLREPMFDDWPAVHGWAARPEASRYQTWGPNTPEETQDHVRRMVAAAAASPRTDYSFLAVDRTTGQVVGSGSLLTRNERFRGGEIAYIVHPDHWRQGLATEMAAALLRLGFDRLGLHRIAGTFDPRNVASARVLQRLGMTYEGRLRQNQLTRDGWRDTDLYAVLKHEWRAEPV
jgi:RimJ/RimL family protein N-acetyltransferase